MATSSMIDAVIAADFGTVEKSLNRETYDDDFIINLAQAAYRLGNHKMVLHLVSRVAKKAPTALIDAAFIYAVKKGLIHDVDCLLTFTSSASLEQGLKFAVQMNNSTMAFLILEKMRNHPDNTPGSYLDRVYDTVLKKFGQ